MLILTRRIGETVMIGNEVSVTVVGVKGSQVRVGIQAPRSIAVHRDEIYKRIQREGVTASNSIVSREPVTPDAFIPDPEMQKDRQK